MTDSPSLADVKTHRQGNFSTGSSFVKPKKALSSIHPLTFTLLTVSAVSVAIAIPKGNSSVIISVNSPNHIQIRQRNCVIRLAMFARIFHQILRLAIPARKEPLLIPTRLCLLPSFMCEVG